MGENFTFFLPVMMASFGIAFAIVWRWGADAAALWSGAFFCIAGGFAAQAGFAALPSLPWGVLADLLFASGFLLFGQALLNRWRPGWLWHGRVAIWGLSVLLSIAATAFDNMRLAMVVSDFSRFLLIGLPLIAGRSHLKQSPDRVLFAAVALIALGNLIRGGAVPFILMRDGYLSHGDHAFLIQAIACTFGLFLALSALAVNMIDLLGHYQREALTDPLSGLLNRRGFEEIVAGLSRKKLTEGSLIVCDIDHFKTINDEFGHARGDRVIIALAGLFEQFAPPGAVAARFGGEEFVLFLPGMNAARAGGIANDIRESFAEQVGEQLGLGRNLSASFGLSIIHRDDPSIHDAIARADEALYDAKARGRNRVCVRRALATPHSGPAASPSRAVRA